MEQEADFVGWSLGRTEGNASLRVIPAHESDWARYINPVPHDVFQTNAYYQIWTEVQGGEAFIAVYGHRDKYAAWPYVRQAIPGLDSAARQPFYDITSAYGYGGPVLRGCENDRAFLHSAWREFCNLWRSQRVITVFTTFHPILANHQWMLRMSEASDKDGVVGGIMGHGRTVAIDTRRSNEQVWTGYSRQLRQAIRHSVAAGVRVVHDPAWRYLDDFVRLYYSTMKRNNASQFYYFPPTYFGRLKHAASHNASLMVALYNESVVTAALLLECDSIVNMHLVGADASGFAVAPVKLLFHHTQAWARERGNRYLHLGGGRGCRENDELFRFKRLFSDCTFPYYTGRWILAKEQYNELISNYDGSAVLPVATWEEEFFPPYRRRV